MRGQMLALKLLSEMRAMRMAAAKIGTSVAGVGFKLAGAMWGGLPGVVLAQIAFSTLYLTWMVVLTVRLPAADVLTRPDRRAGAVPTAPSTRVFDARRGTFEQPRHDTWPDVQAAPVSLPLPAVLFRRVLYERRGGFVGGEDPSHAGPLWVRYADEATFAPVRKDTSLYRVPIDEPPPHAAAGREA